MNKKRLWSPASRGEKNLLMGIKQPRRSYSLHAAARSHRGLLRANNEDNLYFNGITMPLENMDDGCVIQSSSTDSWQVFSVLDGMGGEKAGELASFTVAQVLKETLSQKPADVMAAICKAVKLANQRVLDLARNRNVGRMGTTIAMLYFLDGRVGIANIGDSRIYLFRQGVLSRLTEDQTDAYRKLKMGLITADQALHDPGRHVLTQHIGIDPEEMELEPVFVAEFTPVDGDIFLLCSDGLYDSIDHTLIADSLIRNSDVSHMAQNLVEDALKNGGRDNITVIAVGVRKAKWSFLKCRLINHLLRKRQN